jgi:hypothetical protein
MPLRWARTFVPDSRRERAKFETVYLNPGADRTDRGSEPVINFGLPAASAISKSNKVVTTKNMVRLHRLEDHAIRCFACRLKANRARVFAPAFILLERAPVVRFCQFQ